MAHHLPIDLEKALQIAWDFLDASGDIDDPQQTAEHLLTTIRFLMLRGEARTLALSNRAIDAYRRDRRLIQPRKGEASPTVCVR